MLCRYAIAVLPLGVVLPLGDHGAAVGMGAASAPHDEIAAKLVVLKKLQTDGTIRSGEFETKKAELAAVNRCGCARVCVCARVRVCVYVCMFPYVTH